MDRRGCLLAVQGILWLKDGFWKNYTLAMLGSPDLSDWGGVILWTWKQPLWFVIFGAGTRAAVFAVTIGLRNASASAPATPTPGTQSCASMNRW